MPTEKFIDITFDKFLMVAKSWVENDEITCPIAIVAFHSKDKTDPGTAFIKFEGIGVGQSEVIGDTLRSLSKKLAEEDRVPVSIFFTLVGERMRLSEATKDDDTNFLQRVKDETEGNYDHEQYRNSLLVIARDSSKRTRVYTAKFEMPPDGGVFYYDEVTAKGELPVMFGFTSTYSLLDEIF